MKKQGEQKTKGHKAPGNTVTPQVAPVKTSANLSKETISSLKDKNAAKMKKGKKH